MSAYDSIAAVYDNINAEIDYSAWADFIEKCFSKYMDKKPELVLDLACGTGSMTFELHSRGYDMIGADYSEDMLTEALDKAYDTPASHAAYQVHMRLPTEYMLPAVRPFFSKCDTAAIWNGSSLESTL